MKRKHIQNQQLGKGPAAEKSISIAAKQRLNGRACTHCHRLKIRCDILDKGTPCTSCSSRNRPGCHIYPKKRRGQAAAPSVKLAPILPRGSSHQSASELAIGSHLTSSPPETDTVNPNEGHEESDSSELANFFDCRDVRDADFGPRTRMCFIGTGMSNCHYLVQQDHLRTGNEVNLHLGYSQVPLRDYSYYQAFVPPEIFERPEKKVADMLVRAYFDFANCGWPIVDEEDFRAQYEGKTPENPVSSALLNAIFLVGAHILAPHNDSVRSLQPVFFRRAKTLIDCRFEVDRLVYVQVALLMTWHSDGLEEIIGSAWHWVGIAVRMAMAFGMNRDATRSRMLPVHRRVYTRLWWILFQFDTISSVSSGRPQGINLADSDVPDLEYSHFQGAPTAQKDFVIYQTKLCIIISQTMREGWAVRSSTQDRIRATRKADELLAEFVLQLPETLQLQLSSLDAWQSILHLTYNNFVILLHRPQPKQSIAEGDLVANHYNDPVLCHDATGTIASVFEALVNQDALSRLWVYSSNVLVTATIQIIHEARSSRPIVAARSHRILETLMMALRSLSRNWRYARAWLHFFEERASKLKQQRAAKAQAGDPATSQNLAERVQGNRYSMPLSGLEARAPSQAAEELSSWQDIQFRNRNDIDGSFLDTITNNPSMATGLAFGADDTIDAGVSLPDDLFLGDALWDFFSNQY